MTMAARSRSTARGAPLHGCFDEGREDGEGVEADEPERDGAHRMDQKNVISVLRSVDRRGASGLLCLATPSGRSVRRSIRAQEAR